MSGNPSNRPSKPLSPADDLYVDWDALSSSEWGTSSASLLSFLSFPDVEHLLGWAHHTVDSTHNPEDLNADNPLPRLPNGLGVPPSLLDFLAQQASWDPKQRLFWESQPLSARISTATALEEALVATFLPLASRYVDLCRLQAEVSAAPSSDIEAGDSGTKRMEDWLVPPEEALFRLIHEESAATNSASTTSPSSSSSSLSCFHQWHDAAILLDTFAPIPED